MRKFVRANKGLFYRIYSPKQLPIIPEACTDRAKTGAPSIGGWVTLRTDG